MMPESMEQMMVKQLGWMTASASEEGLASLSASKLEDFRRVHH